MYPVVDSVRFLRKLWSKRFEIPRSDIQTPENLQTSNSMNGAHVSERARTGAGLRAWTSTRVLQTNSRTFRDVRSVPCAVWSLVLGVFLALGGWSVDVHAAANITVTTN